MSPKYDPTNSPSKVNMALWKRYNGYKPFLYNVTFDVCTLLKKPSFNPVIKFWHDIQRFYSNMNQSCPLNVSVFNPQSTLT